MTNPLTTLWGDRDEKKAWKAMEARADNLPPDYRRVYGALKSYLWKFTADNGSDIISVLARILGLFESSATQGRRVADVTGADLASFADDYLPSPRTAYETSWRNKLNRDAAKERD